MTVVELEEIEKRRSEIRQRIRRGGRVLTSADLPVGDLGTDDQVIAEWLADVQAKGGFDLRLPDRLPTRDLPDFR
ncbi:hypothetical protein [Chthonobacter albigriseus]|uniref:hypothetical protein n=1 Tax=Chthonobacter albigriseus TaxID=1683161 RepID=UPI0015EF2152|nr:hypothetical protein [Chthonobacter albigriseus]